ncbi:MAG: glycosyltransferase family 2 protein [Lachnospiraceae bacterium]|nr:glycosyltransferase family 2 protein [Lachnospiraceae bacterium]
MKARDKATEEKREKISFVIPCYNSTNTIGAVAKEIRGVMEGPMKDYDYEIVLVNDGSPDGTTYDAIMDLVRTEKHIKGINLARNFGQPSAVMAALNHTDGDYVVCGDDDGQTPFDELPKLFEKIKEGYDLVEAKYAVREKRSLFRRFGTLMNEGMATWLIAKPRGLELTTYWVVRRFVVNQMIEYPNSYPYLGGLMLRATQNACNVEVTHRERLSGHSGYSLKKMIELWLNGFTSFSVKPLRLMSKLGILVAIAGFLYGIYIIIRKFLDPMVSAGYSSIMAMNLFMFGVVFFFLGLIGEYVGRIYISLNKAPQFVIKEYHESDEM